MLQICIANGTKMMNEQYDQSTSYTCIKYHKNPFFGTVYANKKEKSKLSKNV